MATVARQRDFANVAVNRSRDTWMLVKTGIRGEFHTVSTKYLQDYLKKYSFRYNPSFTGNQQFRSPASGLRRGMDLEANQSRMIGS